MQGPTITGLPAAAGRQVQPKAPAKTSALSTIADIKKPSAEDQSVARSRFNSMDAGSKSIFEEIGDFFKSIGDRIVKLFTGDKVEKEMTRLRSVANRDIADDISASEGLKSIHDDLEEEMQAIADRLSPNLNKEGKALLDAKIMKLGGFPTEETVVKFKKIGSVPPEYYYAELKGKGLEQAQRDYIQSQVILMDELLEWEANKQMFATENETTMAQPEFREAVENTSSIDRDLAKVTSSTDNAINNARDWLESNLDEIQGRVPSDYSQAEVKEAARIGELYDSILTDDERQMLQDARNLWGQPLESVENKSDHLKQIDYFMDRCQKIIQRANAENLFASPPISNTTTTL